MTIREQDDMVAEGGIFVHHPGQQPCPLEPASCKVGGAAARDLENPTFRFPFSLFIHPCTVEMGDEVIGKGNDGKIVSGVQHFHQLDGGVAGCLKGYPAWTRRHR